MALPTPLNLSIPCGAHGCSSSKCRITCRISDLRGAAVLCIERGRAEAKHDEPCNPLSATVDKSVITDEYGPAHRQAAPSGVRDGHGSFRLPSGVVRVRWRQSVKGLPGAAHPWVEHGTAQSSRTTARVGRAIVGGCSGAHGLRHGARTATAFAGPAQSPARCGLPEGSESS